VRDPYLNLSSDSMSFSRDFRDLKKRELDALMDGLRDGWTDRRTVRDPYLNHSSDSMSFSRDFRDLKKRELDGLMDGLRDRWTDRWKNGRTDPLI